MLIVKYPPPGVVRFRKTPERLGMTSTGVHPLSSQRRTSGGFSPGNAVRIVSSLGTRRKAPSTSRGWQPLWLQVNRLP